MTIELRKALRRANLENGWMEAVSAGGFRHIALFTQLGRVIFRRVLDDAEFTEATRWWVMFGSDNGSRKPGFAPTAWRQSIPSGEVVANQPDLRETHANSTKHYSNESSLPIAKATMGIDSIG